MANVYVDSNAAGGGTGADWANAYTTLAAALTAKAAGDNFWVAHNHSFSSGATKTYTSPGTLAAPCTVMCVNSGGTVPPVSADLRTTAVESATGANTITFAAGVTYFYGLKFNAGSGAVAQVWTIGSGSTGDFVAIFESCEINKVGTSAGTNLIGNTATTAASLVKFLNSTLGFGAAGDSLRIRNSRCVWDRGAITGTAPTTLFGASALGGSVIARGVDLSAITGTLVGASVYSTVNYVFDDCKLGAGVSASAASQVGPGGIQVAVLNSDSGATNYRHEKHDFAADQTVETTIVRTDGSTDGTTGVSWKIVTTANAKWLTPFSSLPMTVWNDTTGANITVSVYGYLDAAAVPKNDDIWIEVSYMGASTSPVATINTSNTKADYLAANADQGADSSTWGGGDTTTRFVMSVTLSSPQPAMKGPIYVTVKAAKASTTYYIDPKPVITGVVAGKSYIVAPGVYATVSGVAANPRLGYVL
jgi:hypothetical protein